MSEILPFVNSLVFLDATTLRRLVVIVFAILAMTGRVTMLGISRWTEKGGSYRTVQRFFDSKIDWDDGDRELEKSMAAQKLMVWTSSILHCLANLYLEYHFLASRW